MAERPRLDAIVFDAGGTLVRVDFAWLAAMLATLGFATDAAAVRRAELAGRRAYDAVCERVLATLPEGGGHAPLSTLGPSDAYFTGTFAALGVPAALHPEALRRTWEYQRSDRFLWGVPAEGAREALDALAPSGLRLACVSNADGRAERILESCGVRAGLEFVVDSHVVGIEKPDPRIFALALGRLGVAPERALYVGDIRSVDAAGAAAAGMHFVLIDPIGDYATAGMHRIPAIAALPEFVNRTFTIPAHAGGGSA
ncbi:MAG: HAD family hydrolase [Candidatus Eisenbacteria bacterium]